MTSTKSSFYHNLGDRVPFWGSKTSNELKYLQRALANKSISVDCQRELLKMILVCFNQTTTLNAQSNESYLNRFKQLSTRFNQSPQSLLYVFLSMLKLFQSAIGYSTQKPDVIKEDLTHGLNLPNEFVDDFMGLINSQKKEKIEKYICKKQEKYAHMKSLNWRVDVGISSSSVLKLIVATVVFQVETSDGRVYCFEVPLNKFHLLRFSVAQALKEIDDLLNRNVLKIYD